MTKSLKIAIADDDPSILEFYQIVLSELGHKVVCSVGNGRELVDQCREDSPDLVIIDIKMPQLDGIEAIQQLSRHGAIPAIVVSGHHDPKTIRRAEDEYILAYLIKPVRENDLEVAISIAMRRYEEFEMLRGEAHNMQQVMKNRKIVIRATRTFMELGMEEEQAFERLQRLARKQNCTLFEIAKTIAVTDDTLTR